MGLSPVVSAVCVEAFGGVGASDSGFAGPEQGEGEAGICDGFVMYGGVMTIDTAATLDIRGSRAKLAGLVLIGVALTALSLWIIIAGIAPPGSFGELAGYVGVPFFGAATAVGVYRLFTAARAVLTISPQGLRDIRIADAFIPWPTVARESPSVATKPPISFST